MDKECVFTSVSGQDQAFVPAHTVLRGVVQPPPMYGAHGQPLPPASHGVPSGQLSRQSQSPLSSAAGPCPVHYDYGPLSACSDNASRDALADRKRLHPGPHTPTLPPPHPGSASQAPHQGNGEGYACPEPPSVIPAASTANTPTHYSSAPPPAQPYYTARPPSQASPQSACHYEPSCTSSSPDSQAPTLPGISLMPYYAAPPQPNGALQPPPACSDGRTLPPSTSTPPPRPSMRINDLVSDNGPSRNSIDSSMVNMLNRRPM
ncbi:hypothetical protein AA0117_g13399 [Alternaria alternata]|jgi:hypothetical protein|uniref:Uncharacterized protein n=1 Tax=Alternaria alternata TaxID=5599 RepID=A0A4Q4MHZ2_ALTAL|nr:hypothetical protein AA0117_g13399 [Alternaria alternata]